MNAALERTDKPSEPHAVITQYEVHDYRWYITDPSHKWGLTELYGCAMTLGGARRASRRALIRYLRKKGVAGRQWTLTLEQQNRSKK